MNSSFVNLSDPLVFTIIITFCSGNIFMEQKQGIAILVYVRVFCDNNVHLFHSNTITI